MNDPDPDLVAARTRTWMRAAVIGLELCPFAGAADAKDRVRIAVCESASPEALLAALVDELHLLADADPAQVETTLLVAPAALPDFEDFNDFLDAADAAVQSLGLEGTLQVASFHPGYRFEGTEPDDVTNATNRSPYPTLHLLREASVERAVQAFPAAEVIFENNMRTLERLGLEGWSSLREQWEGERGPEGPEEA